ncbi:MAG: VWA domain-containing protein [Candidatus Korobacteraceae bacterium]
MRTRRPWLATLVMASAFIYVALVCVTTLAQAQQAQPQTQQAQSPVPPVSDGSTPVFKAETRLVLVDTVVTDKKGNYITGLTAKDFKVWEDNKEQPIKSFSAEGGSAAPSEDHRHYLVLLFDNSTISFSDQAQAREAAAKFVEANAGPDRYIAIMNFGCGLSVAQNFTADAERLKQVVRNVKFSNVSPNAQPTEVASLGAPQLGNAEANFGVRDLLQALRSVAKSLASVPGRKSLILLTAGFSITPGSPYYFEQQSELMAVIDASNKANVAIYPIDVRGLVAPFSAAPGSARLEIVPDFGTARLVTATLDYSADDQPAHLVYVQRSGGGRGVGGGTGVGTGGTGTHGGATTGTSGSGTRSGGNTGTGGTGTRGSGGSVPMNPGLYGYNPYDQSHQLIPSIPNVVDNQQVLYQLAQGTGGLVIVNSNDLLGGMQKIAREQTEYYVLGYAPPPSEEGTCHTLKVKVDRGGTITRWRTGYCNVKPTDMLAGKPEEKQMENRVTGSQPGTIAASMLAPYFYTSANTARVNLAIEIPPNAIKFEKQKGKPHATVSVLGLAYKLDGTVAARFSDSLNLDFEDKKQVQEFNAKPFHYDTQFDIAAGHYDLKVVFNPEGADTFGKLEMPLVIDPYDGKQFTLSAVALSKEIRPVSQMGASLDAALLEDRTPLVTQGLQLIPSGSDQFKKTDRAGFYVEIYDSLLTGANPPKVGIKMLVVDRKTGEKKIDSGGAAHDAKAGSALVPLGLILPVDKLPPGSYRLELKAVDSAGNVSQPRTADFEVE